MQHARENPARSWQSHRGLMGLLSVGLIIGLLALVGPHAWATPTQSPLRQTTPNILTPADCFRACDEPVYLQTAGSGLGPITTTVPVYVTENALWVLGLTQVGDLEVVHQTTVDVVDGHFSPNPALIWDVPLEPGCYDVFFDVNGNGVLDDGDGILGPLGPQPGAPCFGDGICVVPCEFYIYLPLVVRQY